MFADEEMGDGRWAARLLALSGVWKLEFHPLIHSSRRIFSFCIEELECIPQNTVISVLYWMEIEGES